MARLAPTSPGAWNLGLPHAYGKRYNKFLLIQDRNSTTSQLRKGWKEPAQARKLILCPCITTGLQGMYFSKGHLDWTCRDRHRARWSCCHLLLSCQERLLACPLHSQSGQDILGLEVGPPRCCHGDQGWDWTEQDGFVSFTGISFFSSCSGNAHRALTMC